MKNVNTIHEQVTTNREQWFQYRRTLESNLSTLEALYAAQYDAESPLYHSTPAQTVAAFVESVGYEAAVEIVASLVNRSAWDGRISRRCAEWANTQENSWDEEACSRLSIYAQSRSFVSTHKRTAAVNAVFVVASGAYIRPSDDLSKPFNQKRYRQRHLFSRTFRMRLNHCIGTANQFVSILSCLVCSSVLMFSSFVCSS